MSLQRIGSALPAGVSSEELGYLANVTSDIQGQINAVSSDLSNVSNTVANIPVVNVTNWTAYTPTTSWGATNVTASGFYKVVGDTLEVQVHIACSGTVNTAILNISYPSGYIFDTDKFAGESNESVVLGIGSAVDAGVSFYAVQVVYYGTSMVRVQGYYDSASGAGYIRVAGLVAQNVPFTFDNGDFVNVRFSVPWKASA
jgi:hypothetical protein